MQATDEAHALVIAQKLVRLGFLRRSGQVNKKPARLGPTPRSHYGQPTRCNRLGDDTLPRTPDEYWQDWTDISAGKLHLWELRLDSTAIIAFKIKPRGPPAGNRSSLNERLVTLARCYHWTDHDRNYSYTVLLPTIDVLLRTEAEFAVALPSLRKIPKSVDKVSGDQVGKTARPESSMIEPSGLGAAVEQAADGIVITDNNGKIQYVNPAFSLMTGYSRQDVVGHHPRILKSGRQPAKFYKELWNIIRSGQVWHGELVNRRKNGTFYTEEMRITPVMDPKGEIVSYIAIKRDVTERRAAEEAQKFLAAIVESSEDAIVAYTPDGVILTWNRGAERISGYSAGDAIGKHVSMLVPADRLAELTQFSEQILLGDTASQPEGMCLRKDGRSIYVSLTGAPIRD